MEKETTVSEFLTFVFEKTLKNDLNQMMSHPLGLDFGIISLVCSGIELIGALDRGSTGDSEELFGKALEKYFPPRYKRFVKTLYRLYRHGLAHQAFIKPGTATSRNPNYKEYHLWGLLVEEQKTFFVHPDVFVQDFFDAVDKYKKSLKENPSKTELAYQTIEKLYRAQHPEGEPIELYKSLPTDDLNVTRMPIPKYLKRTEVSGGVIKIE